MKVGRAQSRVGAVVNARHKARRDVERAAQRDHEVGKVAAHALAIEQRVDGRSAAVG